MKRDQWVPLLIFAVALAVSLHGLITETGLVGWINHGQQSVFGAYSLKVSLMLSLFAILLVGFGAWGLVARVTGGGTHAGRASVAELSAAANRPATAHSLAWMFVAMIAATWVIGFAVHAWLSHQQRDDASATYEPLVLVDGVPVSAPKGSHLALRGDLLTRHGVAHSSGRGSSQKEDYQLLPLAAPGWQPGKPVNFVVKIRGAWELPGATTWPRRAQPQDLMVRLDGDVPVAAAQQFKKMGVVLAEPNYLLHLVPTKDGRVAVSDSSAEDFQVMLYLCGGISVLLLFFGAVVAVGMKRRARMFRA